MPKETRKKIENSKIWLECDEPECQHSLKRFRGLRGLKLHKIRIHNKTISDELVKKYTSKLKEIATINTNDHIVNPGSVLTAIKEMSNMSDVPKDTEKNSTTLPIEQSKPETIDYQKTITALTDQVNNLTNMIPKDFCTEFPKLCSINKRMDTLETNILDMSNKIPKNIKINMPKSEPVAIDNSSLVAELTDKLKSELPGNFNLNTDELNKFITEQVNKLSSDIDNLTKSEQQNKDDILSKLTKEPEKVIVEKEILKEVHNNVDDYLSCPGCRSKIFNSIKDKVANEQDSEYIDFINELKLTKHSEESSEPVTESGNRSGEDIPTTSNAGSRGAQETGESSSPEASSRTSEGTEQADHATTAQESTTPQNEDQGSSDISDPEVKTRNSECTETWCLFR